MRFALNKPTAIISTIAAALTCGLAHPLLALADSTPENITVSMPTQMDYIALPDGRLLGPSPSALYLENEGSRQVRVSAMSFAANSGWNLVENASQSNTINAVSISIGPGDDQKSVASLSQQQTAVGESEEAQAAWTLATKHGDTSFGWSSSLGALEAANSRIALSTGGQVANLSSSTSSQPIGTTGWYLVDSTVTNDVYDRLDALSTSTQSLEARVDALETSNTALASQISSTSSQLSTATSTLSTVQSDIATLKTTTPTVVLNQTCNVNSSAATVEEYCRWSKYGRVVIVDLGGIHPKTVANSQVVITDLPVMRTRPVTVCHDDYNHALMACFYGTIGTGTLRMHAFNNTYRAYGQIVYITD